MVPSSVTECRAAAGACDHPQDEADTPARPVLVTDRSATVLPDVLQPGLRLVFCGTAAGRVSAAAGAYYANPGNAFWRTLHEVGLTPRRLAPGEFQMLPRYGIGLTDLAKHHVGNDHELPDGAFDAEALRERILRYMPAWLAFTSKNAAQGYIGRPLHFGEQDWTVGRTRVFVLPSPSGQARRSWDPAHWSALARRVAGVGVASIRRKPRHKVSPNRGTAAPTQPAGLRLARPSDAAGILGLEALFPSDRMSSRALHRLLNSSSARIWVVAEPAKSSPRSPSQILATLVLLVRSNTGIARIYSVVVAPQARGRGLAAALIGRAEAFARRAGKREMMLEVRTDNPGAQALYRRLDYVEQEHLPGYYEDGSDGLRFRRRLARQN